MCLASVDAVTQHKKKRVGYKVMERHGDTFDGRYHGMETMVIGREYTSYGRRMISSRHVEYKSGYHIYLSKAFAMGFVRSMGGVVVKVKFRKVVASGMEEGTIPTIIAKHMTILEEIRRANDY